MTPLGMPQGLIEHGDLRARPCRYGVMLYSLHDVYIGRALETYGEYGEQEVALYRQLIKRGDVIVDAGANIGAFSVFFAKAVGRDGRVHAFEPQRVIYHMLCANIALNRLHNVSSYLSAVGAAPGEIDVPPIDYGKANNFGGISLVEGKADGEAGDTIPVRTIDSLELAQCDLIKIDVEGMESEVLKGAQETIARCQPLLYMENNRREQSADLIGQVFDLGYRLFWHTPFLYNPKNFFRQRRNLFGNTLNVNVICLPKDDPRNVDLKEITSIDDWWKPEEPEQEPEQETQA